MEADLRQTVSDLEDTSGEPGDLPAQRVGERMRETLREEGPLTDYQIGMIGGGLLGFAAGLLIGAVFMIGYRRE